MSNRFNIKWRPELFQGRYNKPPYFEGWYFKQVDVKGRIVSLIPGIQKETGISSAFIQVIYGSPTRTSFISYPYSSFKSSNTRLELHAGSSTFSLSGMKLDMKNNDTPFSGELEFRDPVSLKSSPLSPGIMGWYQLVPGMECLHGLVSAHHRVSGRLILDGDEYLFDDSDGYIEKDWGRSFPEAWIWAQTNSFSDCPANKPAGSSGSSPVSTMLSIARVPWRGSSFTGFLGFVYYGGSFYRFGTYTGHKMMKLDIDDNKVNVKIEGRRFSVSFILEKGASGLLKAPVAGKMIRDISESINGTIAFELTRHQTGEVICCHGSPAGVEIVGDLDLLLSGFSEG